MRFFNRKSKTRVYHPQDIEPNTQWFLCNALLGASDYEKLGKPLAFSKDLGPEWYKEIEDETILKQIWNQEDSYVTDLLSWFDKKGITDFYFDGAQQTDENWFMHKYQTEDNGGISSWRSSMISDLLKVNINNVYLRAADGSQLIVYETWETVFVDAEVNSMSSRLRKPMQQILA